MQSKDAACPRICAHHRKISANKQLRLVGLMNQSNVCEMPETGNIYEDLVTVTAAIILLSNAKWVGFQVLQLILEYLHISAFMITTALRALTGITAWKDLSFTSELSVALKRAI